MTNLTAGSLSDPMHAGDMHAGRVLAPQWAAGPKAMTMPKTSSLTVAGLSQRPVLTTSTTQLPLLLRRPAGPASCSASALFPGAVLPVQARPAIPCIRIYPDSLSLLKGTAVLCPGAQGQER